MKKFAVLLTTAVLGSAVFAAGSNMLQDAFFSDPSPAPFDEPQPNPIDRSKNPEPFPREELPENDGFLKPVFGEPGPRKSDSSNSGFYKGDAGGGSGTGMGRGSSGVPDMNMGMGGAGGIGRQESRYMRPRSVTRTIVETRMEAIPKEEIAELKKLEEATRLLHTSKDEAERKKAADTIRDQLNAQFDRDLDRREKELTTIEARLKALRDQVEKRKAARDRIVGLRLDTIVNEAEGLGFPGDSIRTSGPDSFGPADGTDPFGTSTAYPPTRRSEITPAIPNTPVDRLQRADDFGPNKPAMREPEPKTLPPRTKIPVDEVDPLDPR